MRQAVARFSRPVFALFDPKAWAYFAHCYRQRSLRLLGYSLIAAMRSLLLIPILLMISEIFDVAIPGSDPSLLVKLAAGIVAVRILSSLILILMRRLIVREIHQVIMEMRRDLVAHLYRLNRGFYTAADTNSLHARIVQDSARVDQMSNALYSAVIPALMTTTVLMLVLFFLQWQLTLLACAAVPLVFLATRYSGRAVQQRVSVFQQAFEQFSKGVQFTLRYMALTQEQGTAQTEVDRRNAELDDLREKAESMSVGFLLSAQLNETIITIVGMLVVVAGGMAIMTNTLTLGEFIAFYSAAGMLNGQLGSLTGGLPGILSGNESLRKLQALRSIDAEQPYRGRRQIEFKGAIEFRQVSFGYGDDTLLRDNSFLLQAGQTLLITGDNGAGKSTLLHLLMGFWRPNRGQLLADGVAYDELDVTALRRAIGYVPQRPDMIAGTLAENIGYRRDDLGNEQIRFAAHLAGADAFIDALDNGYQSQVGDDGVKLSGGERQKLAIARALIGEPALLILDEPTNHMDADAVSRMLRTLRDRNMGMSLLIISHDQRVAPYADRIFHLQDGRLIGSEP